LIERFEFDPSKKARAYSKGNRQKIVLIAALASRAELLILDEPTSGLDPEAARDVRSFILDLRDAGRAIFLCTHNLDEARRLCDRLAIFKSKVLRLGTPREVEREVVRRRLAIRMAGPPEQFLEVVKALPVSQGVEIGEGDFLVFRTGHHRRRLELGPWDNSPPPRGEGKAGLHVDTIPWMHERRIAAFLPDGDGETVPSVVDGITYPIHPLQVAAMGMLVADSLQFEELAPACEEEGRYDFMVVGLPLRLPGGTGSPWNPIAIF